MYHFGKIDPAVLKNKQKIADIVELTMNGSFSQGRIILAYQGKQNQSNIWYVVVPFNKSELKKLIDHTKDNRYTYEWYRDEQHLHTYTL